MPGTHPQSIKGALADLEDGRKPSATLASDDDGKPSAVPRNPSSSLSEASDDEEDGDVGLDVPTCAEPEIVPPFASAPSAASPAAPTVGAASAGVRLMTLSSRRDVTNPAAVTELVADRHLPPSDNVAPAASASAVANELQDLHVASTRGFPRRVNPFSSFINL